jgi:hypothetical protein
MTDSKLRIRTRADRIPDAAQRDCRAPFGATLVLTVTCAFACLLIVMSVVWVAHPPHARPGYLAALGDQNQPAKTALYVLAYAVLLPLAALTIPRLADSVAAGANAPALPVLAALLAGALAVSLLLVKLSALLPWGDGPAVVLAAVCAWGLGAAAALRRASRPNAWPPALALVRFFPGLAIAAVVLTFGVVLCVTAVHSLSAVPLLVGGLATVVVLLRGERLALPRLSRRAGTWVDVAVVVLVALLVPNLLIFPYEAPPPTLLNTTGVMQFHHDFLLGPANQVLRGGVVLANEPASQWGVGPIYMLAAWFHIAPIGYGTYGLLDAGLTVLLYAAAYGVLRVAGVSRLLAISALALAVAVLIYNLQYPVGGLPQQGPLRFGMPVGVLLAAVVAARWERARTRARVAALIVLGISSVWALEGFAYTLFTLAAVTCFEATFRRAGDRLRWLGRQALLALGACVCAHAIFALATLAASGRLPAWGQYGAFVHAFLLGGEAGNITYGFARWSPGVAVAAGYLASAAAVVLLVRRRPELVAGQRVMLTALVGSTAYGIALFSYFDNRSATYLLLYVALPAVLIGTLWLALLLRSRAEVSRLGRSAALAFALSLAVLLVAAAWPSIGPRFSRSPLAEAVPGGHGLRADLRRLWHMPALDPRADEGGRLLRTYLPGQRHVLVLVSPDLGIETLIRSGTANALPIGDPIEESFVASSRIPVLRDAIRKLRPRQRMLMDQITWRALRVIRARPAADPLRLFKRTLQAPLQAWVLKELDTRFRVRPIYRDTQGFLVVELGRRS